MSTRTTFRPQTVITAGSMAGNLISIPTILQSLNEFSYQVTWSGTTPVGTVSIQGSNSYALNPNGTVLNAGTWTTLTVSVSGTPTTTLPISGNTGSGVIDGTPTSLYAVRLIYTAGSGTGSLTAIINAKTS